MNPGIARCFAYGAVKGHPFYDAATLKAPQLEMNYEMYQDQTLSNKGNPIHHFYGKFRICARFGIHNDI